MKQVVGGWSVWQLLMKSFPKSRKPVSKLLVSVHLHSWPPSVLNSLPAGLRNAPSLACFGSQLKIPLFHVAFKQSVYCSFCLLFNVWLCKLYCLCIDSVPFACSSSASDPWLPACMRVGVWSVSHNVSQWSCVAPYVWKRVCVCAGCKGHWMFELVQFGELGHARNLYYYY